MRKNLFITYIKIILAILIICGLTYGTIKFLWKEYDKEEYEDIKTNMLLIQNKIETIAQKVEIKEKDAKYIGTKIEEKENDAKVQNLINNKVIDIYSKDSNYYCINNENLRDLGLENIMVDDYYVVDYKKIDVIYIEGIENKEGNIIYKLSDME